VQPRVNLRCTADVRATKQSRSGCFLGISCSVTPALVHRPSRWKSRTELAPDAAVPRHRHPRVIPLPHVAPFSSPLYPAITRPRRPRPAFCGRFQLSHPERKVSARSAGARVRLVTTAAVRSDDLTVALGTNLFDAAPIRGRAFSAMIAPPGYRCCGAIGTNDAKHLFWLRDRLGERFVGGAVLHTGPDAYQLGDRVMAPPLWTLVGRLTLRASAGRTQVCTLAHEYVRSANGRCRRSGRTPGPGCTRRSRDQGRRGRGERI
jgi:hypothetical protein